MAKTFIVLSLLLLLSISMAHARAPASAPSPLIAEPVLAPESAASPVASQPDCQTSLLNLSSCLSYTAEGSNLTVPDTGCCPSLSSLIDNNPVCLCELLANGGGLGLKIDTARALTLPTACKIDSGLDVSLCSVLGIPVASPMEPAASPGGPEEPGPSTISNMPTAAPAATATAIATSSSAARLATGMVTLIISSLSIASLV